ncbi:MAG: tRNA (adenosine(37)-N6)-threonylcarbamoyltransferase complex dimerization subunit type 1 TsaB [Candidatus Latescibacterota bacterium]|nr:MAG: tRNA (adenosine(37)-N6)-threonylcarbamoyltransferase complex dimerization subunit type 1 TsaB [Candidatus Latescibacterota bacterium]
MNDEAPRDVLVLHTSGAEAVVAAAFCGRFEVEVLDARAQHARTLLGAVEQVLERLGIRVDDLEAIVATTGPGSFTGIRVGLATCQGLAAARGWRVWVCDSLVPEAATHSGRLEAVAVVEDARRHEVYAALYDVREPVPRALVSPFCAAPHVAATRLGAAAERRAVVALGSGASMLQPEWSARGPLQVVARPQRARIAASLYELARRGACVPRGAEMLTPEYLRRPDVRAPGRTQAPKTRRQPGHAPRESGEP